MKRQIAIFSLAVILLTLCAVDTFASERLTTQSATFHPNVSTSQIVFTVPQNKRAVITGFTIHSASRDYSTASPLIELEVESNGGEYGIAHLSTFGNPTTYINVNVPDYQEYNSIGPDEPIYVTVTQGTYSESGTLSIDIFGFYL